MTAEVTAHVAGRTGRRTASKGDLQERRLLEALEQELRTRPLGAIGVSDIAAAAGLQRSAYYFYFASKEEAVVRLLDEVTAELTGAASGFLADGVDRDAAVSVPIGHTIDTWRRHTHLLLGVLDATATSPTVRQLWDAWVEGFVTPIAAELQRRRDAGTSADGPDASSLIRALLRTNIGMLESSARAGRLDEDAAHLHEVLTYIWLAVIGT